MQKTLMKKQNWIITLSGVAATYLGFFLMQWITRNYDGAFAFLTIILVIGGLVTVGLGLSLNFETKEDLEEKE